MPTPPRAAVTAAFPAVILLAAAAGAAPSWTRWGGPSGDFKLPAAKLATWSEDGPRELWSRALGAGYSSVLYEDGRLYTMFRRGGDDDVVVALDAATGAKIWELVYPAPAIAEQVTRFGSGPNATPLIIGDHLVTVSASAIVSGVDKNTGIRLWSHDLQAEYGGQLPRHGYAAAPIAVDGMAVVLAGGAHGAVGFAPSTGEKRWASAPSEVAYATPMVIDVGGDRQLVYMSPDEVVGVGLDDGAVRWRHPHVNQWKTNCLGPWWGEDGLLLVSSGGDAGSRTLKLTRAGGETAVEEVSASNKFQLSHSTPLRLGARVYGASGKYLAAYDVNSGEILWREEGYKKANLMLAGDRVLALDEAGTLSLLTLTPDELVVHASHPLLSKPAWSPPTLVGTRLFARDTERLVALELGAPSTN